MQVELLPAQEGQHILLVGRHFAAHETLGEGVGNLVRDWKRD